MTHYVNDIVNLGLAPKFDTSTGTQTLPSPVAGA